MLILLNLDKAEVLQFVLSFNLYSNVDDKNLQEKNNIKGSFLFLPNQYWIHKNHIVVLKALKLLIAHGKEVHVLSIENTADYRALRLMDDI